MTPGQRLDALVKQQATEAARVREEPGQIAEAGIKFILIGGAAANLQGSPRFTLDVDVVYSREKENMQALVHQSG